jgi:hypothetical protein
MNGTDSPSDQAARLLLLLSRIVFTDDERLLAANECRSFSDWKRFADLAIKNGVAALVWQNISDLSLSHYVPEPERRLMEEIRFKTIARVSYITSAATEVTAALEEEGIKVLLLKGLALEYTLYGSKGLRQMSDADLLVAPEEVIRARDKLVRSGFISDTLKSPLYKHIILELGNHIPMLRRGGMSVDLHHRLFGPEGTGIVRRALQNPDIVRSAGRDFYVLPPRTAFLGLVNHIFKHEIKGEFQLRLYTDIYLLARKYEETIFSENLVTEAAEAGITGKLSSVLSTLKEAYGMNIPLSPDTPQDFGKQCLEDFMRNIANPGALKPQSQKQVFQENLRSFKSLKSKTFFVIGDLFPSAGFMKERYECRSVFKLIFSYIHRLGKLIWVADAVFTRMIMK